MKRPRILSQQSGFTLIEIIAVLILLGILAAVAVPKFMSLQEDAELKAVAGVKSELMSRANQYYAQYLLDNTKINPNAQTKAAWITETLGPDFTLITGGPGTALRVRVTASNNVYRIAFTRGRSVNDGTGYAAKFEAITAE